jgi:integrase
LAGRALTPDEVNRLPAGPDKWKAEGARDHALILTMLRLSLRVSEVASLRASDIRWSHGRWIIKFKVKGRRERTLPLPDDIRAAVNVHLKLEAKGKSTQSTAASLPSVANSLVSGINVQKIRSATVAVAASKRNAAW